jgi:hypothetical protein
MPTKNIQTEDNGFYNSEKLADKFILFLKRTAREDGGFFDENKNIILESKPSVKNNNYNIKYEVIDEPENKESRLAKVLDIKENYKKIEDDFDIEEKLTNDWLNGAKKFNTSLPITPNQSKAKSGFKINLKNPIKILMPPGFHYFLPPHKSNKEINATKSLALPMPLALKLTALIIVALVLSVFIELSSPKLSNKIISFSDNIFRIPTDQINLFAVNIMPELMVSNDKFYDQIDKLIAGNTKIKADFILNNKDNLENNQNINTSFLITREDLLGMPASAEEINTGQTNTKTMQEQTDTILQKIGNKIEKFLDYMTKKQTDTSLRMSKKRVKNKRVK